MQTSDGLQGTRFQVLFHPLRGTFHHSSRYYPLSVDQYFGQQSGLGRFTQRFHEPRATRHTVPACTNQFRLRGITHYGHAFPDDSATTPMHLPAEEKTGQPHKPYHATPAGITRTRFSLHPLSLATTHGISSFPTGTEMFHFPAFPHTLYRRCR